MRNRSEDLDLVGPQRWSGHCRQKGPTLLRPERWKAGVDARAPGASHDFSRTQRSAARLHRRRSRIGHHRSHRQVDAAGRVSVFLHNPMSPRIVLHHSAADMPGKIRITGMGQVPPHRTVALPGSFGPVTAGTPPPATPHRRASVAIVPSGMGQRLQAMRSASSTSVIGT